MIDAAAIVAAWRANKASGKRTFHDWHSEYIAVAQRLFGYWTQRAGAHTPWFEIGNIQLPADYMNYMDAILKTRPRVIVECGTCGGGSAAVFAEMLRRIVGPDFRVITIERNAEAVAKRWIESDPNIISLIGDTTDPGIIARVRSLIPEAWPTMVALDSAHDGLHVCREIGAYAPMVTPGQYLIVEDTFLGLCWGGNLSAEQSLSAIRRGAAREFDYHDCPLGAVEALLDTSTDFEIDQELQRYVLTLHPFGWLRRRRT